MGAKNTLFNAKIYIVGTSVLHMVDDATHLNAAQFVELVRHESVWETILLSWAIV